MSDERVHGLELLVKHLELKVVTLERQCKDYEDRIKCLEELFTTFSSYTQRPPLEKPHVRKNIKFRRRDWPESPKDLPLKKQIPKQSPSSYNSDPTGIQRNPIMDSLQKEFETLIPDLEKFGMESDEIFSDPEESPFVTDDEESSEDEEEKRKKGKKLMKGESESEDEEEKRKKKKNITKSPEFGKIKWNSPGKKENTTVRRRAGSTNNEEGIKGLEKFRNRDKKGKSTQSKKLGSPSADRKSEEEEGMVSNQKKIFTVYLPHGDKKSWIPQPLEPLKISLEKICTARGIDFHGYIPIDSNGGVVSLDSPLGKIYGGEIFYILKGELEKTGNTILPLVASDGPSHQSPSKSPPLPFTGLGGLSPRLSIGVSKHKKSHTVSARGAKGFKRERKVPTLSELASEMSKRSNMAEACTFLETRKDGSVQKWYNCSDCGFTQDIGVCAVCAQVCHRGHQLSSPNLSRIACACGTRGRDFCKCWNDVIDEKLLQQAEKERERFQVMTELQERVLELWNTSLSKCSIGADLSRLASKNIIYGKNGVELYPENENYSLTGSGQSRSFGTIPTRQTSPVVSANKTNFENVKELLGVLSDQLGVKEIHEKRFESHFSIFLDEKASQTADLSRMSNDYVMLLGDDDILVKLLKASCNQAIVSPTWMNIKMNILKEFPFKDIKHGWKIFVIFSEDDISVIHRKKEQGINKETQKEEFSFVWELKLVFSLNMEKLKSAIYGITEVNISDDMDVDKSAHFRNKIRIWKLQSFVPCYYDGSPRLLIIEPDPTTNPVLPPDHETIGNSTDGGNMNVSGYFTVPPKPVTGGTNTTVPEDNLLIESNPGASVVDGWANSATRGPGTCYGGTILGSGTAIPNGENFNSFNVSSPRLYREKERRSQKVGHYIREKET